METLIEELWSAAEFFWGLANVNWALVIQIVTATITASIAVVAVSIAYQQHITSRRQLRLALFEKRLAIYNLAMDLIASVVRHARAPEIQDIQKFAFDTRNAYFLFGPDIADYMDEFHRQALELNTVHFERGEGWAARSTELVMWFLNQARVARDRFGKYMSFRDVQ